MLYAYSDIITDIIFLTFRCYSKITSIPMTLHFYRGHRANFKINSDLISFKIKSAAPKRNKMKQR